MLLDILQKANLSFLEIPYYRMPQTLMQNLYHSFNAAISSSPSVSPVSTKPNELYSLRAT